MITPQLSAADFAVFFREVHGSTPFPWQVRLTQLLAARGKWPDVLDLPTGSGKTAALDIAVFHLALEADRGPQRQAPARVVLAVDRRLIVDDAYLRACRLAAALAVAGPDSVVGAVAARLRLLSGGATPLIVRRLRGGIPREDDWALTPAQPTILCSTVDQVGSRLLFRGYGISDRAKPLQAGLLGADCHILLDEAHLAEPFRQTLAWVRHYHGDSWREEPSTAPWGVSLLTATPGQEAGERFVLDAADYADLTLRGRWMASKPARLVELSARRSARTPGDATDPEDAAGGGARAETAAVPAEERDRARAMASEVSRALGVLRSAGVARPAIGVVVNRVARARAVYERLCEDLVAEPDLGVFLMIGPARGVDRDRIAAQLRPIRTQTWEPSEPRRLDQPLVLVATQCIEAGVDIDLDGLITDLAPLDSLRQRFGRLNRAGRSVPAYGAIVAAKADIGPRAEDPIYGRALEPTWKYLLQAAVAPGGRGEAPCIDFGLSAMDATMERSPVPLEALSPRASGPVLLPAHLDLLSQTAPPPSADPDPALYLHGPNRQPASVSVLWRGDLRVGEPAHLVRRRLHLVPPRSAESIQLPVWAVRRWLAGSAPEFGALADVAGGPSGEDGRPEGGGEDDRHIFRWLGDEDESDWIDPTAIRPGDTLIVPSVRGGVDAFGWNPTRREAASDVADLAARPFWGRTFAIRVAPGLLGTGEASALAETRLAEVLAADGSSPWSDLRDALIGMDLPEAIRNGLLALDRANGRRSRPRVEAHIELYGTDEAGRPRGAIFVAPFGLSGEAGSGEQAASTEEDSVGSFEGIAVLLDSHCACVGRTAERFARQAGLPEQRVQDLALAGYLHDAGKADPRFQAVLAFSDPLGPDDERVLAKSARTAPRDAGQRMGLPARWRHEALSVRMAALHPRLEGAPDPGLVLWLIGTHHGWGRPFFPAGEETSDTAGGAGRRLPPVLGLPGGDLRLRAGPESLGFDWRGLTWADLFVQMKRRYGVWGLARFEAILRLADHRVSADERSAGVGVDA